MLTEKKIAYVMTLLFVMLAIRMGYLQLLQGPELKRLSEENRAKVTKIPSPRGIIYDRNGTPLVENRPYFCVSLQPEFIKDADINAIANFLGVSSEDIQRKIQNKNSFEAVRLREGLTFEEITFISARLSDYPGLDIEVDVARHYLYGDVGAHVIGYLGKLSPVQAKSPALKNVPPESFIGQRGAEQLFDDSLRGIAGERVIEVDALGRELRLVRETLPVNGKDIYLSIDLNLQREAERALGENAGAVVALEPNTGKVLALVSKPSFDPNLFAKGISYENWLSLQTDPRYPMLNRALQSQYPPGSVFKIITSIAALEDKAITPETTVTCSGGLSLGKWSFGCWRKEGHGTLSFHNALVQSCDVYFYTAGRRTGITGLASHARELGIGSPSGLNLVKEKTGFMPDEEWKKNTKGQPWYQGETYITSIGQGYVLMTPLQVARLISAVASGYLYEPTMVMSESSQPPKKLNISPETLEEVRSALRGVVNEPGGTGHAANSRRVSISGKTGTAQVRSSRGQASQAWKFRDHAWFAAYAPFEEPQIAIAVFVEHGGHGGSAAAPIARRAIEAYLIKNEDKQISN